MSLRLAFVLPALLLAPACDQAPTTQPKQPVVVRSEVQNQLAQLDEMGRAIALKRAIYASGSTCQRVEASGFAQEYDNLSMWVAECADGRDWAIFVGPDGSAQVRPCKDNAELGLPACVIRPSVAKPA